VASRIVNWPARRRHRPPSTRALSTQLPDERVKFTASGMLRRHGIDGYQFAVARDALVKGVLNARMALWSARIGVPGTPGPCGANTMPRRQVRTSRRSGPLDVSRRKRRSVALPPDRHLGTDSNQHCCLSVRGKPQSIGTQRVPVQLRPCPGTVLRLWYVRQLAVVDQLSSLRQQHVLARRVAAPDRQYVDLVAVR